MKAFRVSKRYYLIILLGSILLIFLIDLMLFLEGDYFSILYAKIFILLGGTAILLVFMDAIFTKIIVEEDRLIYKQFFRTRCIYYKDIKQISYQKGIKDYQITVWLLNREDYFVFKPLKTIGIKYYVKDYKILVKLIVEKCKDNPKTIIQKRVLNLIK